jgi:hypothetical protein
MKEEIMKNRMLPLFAALVLAVSAPLWAQLDEPVIPQESRDEAIQSPMEQEVPEYTEENVAAQDESQDENTELPQTAGLTPLMALLGIASGAGALALRRRS